MSNSPMVNLTVDIPTDENGMPSTKPADVLRFSQQILFKTVMGVTESGNRTPTDSKEVNALTNVLKTMSQTALTSVKLEQEERAIGNQEEMVEMFKQFKALASGSNLYTNDGKTSRQKDPYEGITPPSVEISATELIQGEQQLNPDAYLADD